MLSSKGIADRLPKPVDLEKAGDVIQGAADRSGRGQAEQTLRSFVPDRATAIEVHRHDAFAAGADEQFGERLFLVEKPRASPRVAYCHEEMGAESCARQGYANQRDDDLPELRAGCI